MLKNTLINRVVTKKIASALGELNDQVVYVGGAVVSLYVDDPTADDVRPTKDLDLTMEIASLGALEELREELLRRGFRQTAEDSVICRFRYEDILVDVMATVPVGWAPGNRWFAMGFDHAFTYTLDDWRIRLLPLPYFLASKLDAFFDRGVKDLYASHDFEDIVYLFNHVSDIDEQAVNSESTVKEYLIECSRKILDSSAIKEAIVGNLYYELQDQRLELILNKLNKIVREL